MGGDGIELDDVNRPPLVLPRPGGLDRQPCLSDAAWPHNGDELMRGKSIHQAPELDVATDEPVMLIGTPSGRHGAVGS